MLLLDRVTDPHNVGAILRSAEVFGARAVIAPRRHAAPETGALAKAASGALERQPYLRVPNLAGAIQSLREMGYGIVGLDGAAEGELGPVLGGFAGRPLALALGAEGPGMRQLTASSATGRRGFRRRRASGRSMSRTRRRWRFMRRRGDRDACNIRSHFPDSACKNAGAAPILRVEAAGMELPCFISLSLVPTERPDPVRALLCVSITRSPNPAMPYEIRSKAIGPIGSERWQRFTAFLYDCVWHSVCMRMALKVRIDSLTAGSGYRSRWKIQSWSGWFWKRHLRIGPAMTLR